MIFGKTYDQRKEWHRVFAWFPVSLNDGRWAWLQYVWRRRGLVDPIWFYALDDVVEEEIGKRGEVG